MERKMEINMEETNQRKNKERLKLFFENKTLVFLKIRFGESTHYHNGYIKRIEEKCVILDDIKAGEFPIPFLDIISVDVSNRIKENKNA